MAGVPVTTFTFKDGDGIPPFAAPIPPTISVAVSGDHLYLGVGDFVATALTQDAAASLASDARYANALAAAGSPNAGMAFARHRRGPVAHRVDGLARTSSTRPMSSPGSTHSTTSWLSNLTDEDSLSSKLLLFVK